MRNILKFKMLFLFISLSILLFSCEEIEQISLNKHLLENQDFLEQTKEENFVVLEQATNIANVFYKGLIENKIGTRNSSTGKECNYSVETLNENGHPLMYIINYLDGGFVIIGSSKNYYPILAYSDENSFDLTLEIGGLSNWMKETKKAIITSDILNDTIKKKMHDLWKYYEKAPLKIEKQYNRSRSAYTEAQLACWNRCDELQMKYGGEGWRFEPLSQTEQIFAEAGFPSMYQDLCFSAEFNNSPINASVVGWKDGSVTEQVGPLLTTKWHQNSPFNDLCNGKPAGCAAVAVAQVMKFYHYPQLFTWDGYSFTWDDIPQKAVPGSAQGALLRLVGNAINMHYSSSGSWATPGDLKDGMKFMGYDVTSTGHDYNRVEKELFTHKRPVIMVGNDDNIPLPSPLNYIGNSHYWVCEGAHKRIANRMLYFTEWQPNGKGEFVIGWNTIDVPGLLGGVSYLSFYMNWGWEGKNDGWFAFNNVNSGNGDYEHSRKDFYIKRP